MGMIAYLRKFPEIIPLIICVSAACGMGVFSFTRAAIVSPDAAIDKKNNPHPWQKVKHDQQTKLVPLAICVGVACGGCGWFLARQAMTHPELCIDRKNNPYPWQKVKHDEQRRLYTQTDYSKLEKSRPDYEKH